MRAILGPPSFSLLQSSSVDPPTLHNRNHPPSLKNFHADVACLLLPPCLNLALSLSLPITSHLALYISHPVSLLTEHAAALAKMKPELDAAGVLLIVVGVGTPESGKKFSEALPFPGECLFVDPERAAYRAGSSRYTLPARGTWCCCCPCLSVFRHQMGHAPPRPRRLRKYAHTCTHSFGRGKRDADPRCGPPVWAHGVTK